MIRKLTTSFIVLAALVSISMGAEPQSLLPTQPQLPPSPRYMPYMPVSQATPQPQPQPQTVPMPVPQSTHERMLSTDGCCPGQPAYGNCPGQPLPLATCWSNSCAGRVVHEIVQDTCKANQWPEPFVQYDRDAASMAFNTMIEKGWKRQNTLGDVHFDPNTGDLNMSGHFKVRHILFEGLPSRRDLFVYRGDTNGITQARLHSVQTYVHQLLGNSPNLPQVAVTNHTIPGCSAQYVDAITRKYNQTIPEPRIPKENDAEFTEK